ncbi:hypothetical protein VZT92_009272 [Zoarces viviparus]|uniref:Secreted protein n=1 Tax=Zoarces viviparus TaxID=48416 RepID=A0AAW1FJ52_ZOAVI
MTRFWTAVLLLSQTNNAETSSCARATESITLKQASPAQADQHCTELSRHPRPSLVSEASSPRRNSPAERVHIKVNHQHVSGVHLGEQRSGLRSTRSLSVWAV